MIQLLAQPRVIRRINGWLTVFWACRGPRTRHPGGEMIRCLDANWLYLMGSVCFALGTLVNMLKNR